MDVERLLIEEGKRFREAMEKFDGDGFIAQVLERLGISDKTVS